MRILSFVLVALILFGCSSTSEVQTKTVIKYPDIIHPSKPSAPHLVDFNVMVVNREELQKLLESNSTDSTFFVLTPDNYEIVVLDFNELRQYIEQQKQIILFYKKVLTQPNDEN